MSSPKVVLVTGATGKQGGAVVDALVAASTPFTILAGKKPSLSHHLTIPTNLLTSVTRDTASSSAQKLAAKSSSIHLVQGNLDDVPGIFSAASSVLPNQPIWGVYSVQISMGKGVTTTGEIKQGNDLIDESVKNNVQHFVYSSVERGGDEASWENKTPIPHFQTKFEIEQHLKKNAGSMGWTVLRPVAFFDNLAPGFPSKVFLTALRDTLQGKSIQYVATSDIGWFAAHAFENPEEMNHQALGLAGEELDFAGMQRAFKNATGSDAITTYSFLGSTLMYMVTELGLMITWFGTDGYRADVGKLRSMNPKIKDMETWLKTESGWAAKA